MKHLSVGNLALAGVIALSSIPVVAHPQDRTEALQARALADTTAYAIVEGLTTEIGPRQGGTEREAAARAWSVERLKSLGYQNVRIEPFTMPTWVRGAESAAIVAPFEQKLHVTALGNSGSTGEQGLEGEVVFFPTLADLDAAAPEAVKGKIVFVSHAMTRTQDGSSYGAFGPARFRGPAVAARKGAAAIVIKSIGTDHDRGPHTGNTNFPEGIAPIPAGAVSVPDAENIARMAQLVTARGQALRMRLLLTPRDLGPQQSGNVIAEIPGREPSAGVVLLACHLDSWDLGTGAVDDASGCGIIAAAAMLATADRQPLRTIRLLWAGAEEVGVWGGKAYAEAHQGERHAFAMESDFGAGRVWRIDMKLGSAFAGLGDQLAQAVAPLGIGRGSAQANGGADVGAIIAAQQPAVIDLQQDGTHYFDLHHTPNDTLDKVDPAALAQNVAAWASVVDIIANAPETTAAP